MRSGFKQRGDYRRLFNVPESLKPFLPMAKEGVSSEEIDAQDEAGKMSKPQAPSVDNFLGGTLR